MHETLMGLGAVTDAEAQANGWTPLLQQLAKSKRATRIDAGEGQWWAAERLPQAQALYPDATRSPKIDAPIEYAKPWTREDAALALVRARLTGLGPITAAAMAAPLALPRSDIDLALIALETEGFVMRGHFTPPPDAPADDEWCERHLLARIHRYTIGRLRREIQPVEPRDYMRFLFDWQRVSPTTRVSGPEALAGIVAQLEGFEAPAASWEADLLPARVADYAIAWLDDLCTAGRTTWARLRNAPSDGQGGRTAPVRATPIVLLPRRQLATWSQAAAQRHDEDPPLSSRAEKVADYLRENGASFFDELVTGAHLLRTELEDALAELVARGRVHCDSFAGLRALLVPQSKRASAFGGRRGRRASLFGIEDAGRWTLTRKPTEAMALAPESIEHIARTLLRRYGVVCWRLLEREAAWLPPWRELLRVYHRLEARGEIRGGRFIAGLSGEQFALPEAIGAMRAVRKRPHDGALVSLSALDPLNLVGTVVAGDKVPRQLGARVLYRDGIPVASFVAGKLGWIVEATLDEQQTWRRALLREPAEPALHEKGMPRGTHGDVHKDMRNDIHNPPPMPAR
jgi:ATP-dependent Lhr-like helicase